MIMPAESLPPSRTKLSMPSSQRKNANWRASATVYINILLIGNNNIFKWENIRKDGPVTSGHQREGDQLVGKGS